MKNIKTLILSSSLVFASAAFAYAADSGTTALPFLKMDMGAKYYGMGGAAVAYADDITGASFYNPAALGQVQSFQLSGTTFESAMDMNYTYGGIAVPVGFLSFFGNHPLNIGASVYMFDKGDMEDGVTTRSVGKDTSLALSVGEHIGTNTWDFMGSSSDLEHYLGINAKYIRSTLPKPVSGEVTADVFAFDAGYQAVLDKHFGVGVAFKNIGSKVKYIKEEDPLPYTIAAGAFFTPVEVEYVRWTLSADYLAYVREQENRVRLGSEAVFMDILSVRGGLKLMEEIENEYSIGFGLKLFGFEVDFGTILNPQFNDDKVYQASISYKFPVKKEEPRAQKETGTDKKIKDYGEYKQKQTQEAQEKAERNQSPILYQ